jgi:hypothetical protein
MPPASTPAPASIVLDLRDREPPEPLVAVLEALARMQPGDRLEALLPRRPLLLLPRLDEMGQPYEVLPREGETCLLRLTKR